MALIGSNIFIGNNDEQMFIGTDRYDKTTEPNEVGIITASDGAADDYFGGSVAVGSGRIVVGAYGDDNNGYSSGSAYIFDLDGNEVGIMTASDGTAYDQFGYSVAVGSGRIVVGAPTGSNANRGSAYIFDLNGNQLGILTASDGAASDLFGTSVAVGSGRIVVGAPYGSNIDQGAAYIYDLEGNEVGIITASDGAAYDYFGNSVAVGSGKIVVGADGYNTNQGSAYIFDLDGNQLGILTASDGAADDYFGRSVAVGSGRIVVGAPENNIGSNANQGAAYIYDLNGNEVGIITASDGLADDLFGTSVAVGSGRIVVGAYGDDNNGSSSGSAYIFDLDGNQLGIITASDGAAEDFFGRSVAVGSGRIVVGALGNNIGSNANQGSAYIYDTPKSDHMLDILDI